MLHEERAQCLFCIHIASLPVSHTQERYDAALQEKASLQEALHRLQGKNGGQQQSTPTKSARKGHANGAATTKQLQRLAGQQEALDVVVGLQVGV